MNHGQPMFSVVVPTYNRGRQLAACLDALTRLDYARDRFEVIVVDDGGHTPMDEIVGSCRGRIAATCVRQRNAGPAAARNTGAARARGEFLAFTDDDCRPASDWLRSMAVRLARDPDCVIGGRTTNALPDNRYSSASQVLIDYLYSYYNADPDRARFLTSNNLAVGADRFRSIGGFDTSFPGAAAEDREFCDRWLADGRRIVYASDAVVHHAHPLTFASFCRQHLWYGRGAFLFHRIRARRAAAGQVRIEPLAFYWRLLCFPATRSRGPEALVSTSLLVATQLANAVGFFWERGRAVRRPELRPR